MLFRYVLFLSVDGNQSNKKLSYCTGTVQHAMLEIGATFHELWEL